MGRLPQGVHGHLVFNIGSVAPVWVKFVQLFRFALSRVTC